MWSQDFIDFPIFKVYFAPTWIPKGREHAQKILVHSKYIQCKLIWAVLKVCFSNHHLCIFKWAETETKSEIEKNGAEGGRDGKKEKTAWKGDKQFPANKGWTIGELSVSLPVALSLSEPGQSFSTGIKEKEGWVFCADYWMLFEAFPKGWSYSEKGFLFLWCSSIIHRPFLWFGLSVGRIT